MANVNRTGCCICQHYEDRLWVVELNQQKQLTCWDCFVGYFCHRCSVRKSTKTGFNGEDDCCAKCEDAMARQRLVDQLNAYSLKNQQKN